MVVFVTVHHDVAEWSPPEITPKPDLLERIYPRSER